MMKAFEIRPDLLEAFTAGQKVDTESLIAMTGATDTAFKVMSGIGAAIGSPFGLLPFLGTVYSAGLGKLLEQGAARAWKTNLLTPEMVVDLWRRSFPDTDTRELWFNNLIRAGWSQDQIEGLKKLAEVLPTPSDVIRFAVREAYTPEIAEKYGQYLDFPDKAMTDASQIGLTKDLLSKYWAAHWELPSATQGFDMFHRGIISFDELKTLLRALDVMPYWREKLIKIAYNVLTRVDARRMWDMRVIGDDKLLEVYLNEGYTPEDARALVIWTKVYQTFPDLIARYKNAWINESDVISELVKLGLSEANATELYQTKIKNPVQPERLAPERDLTKTEIYKGIKQKKLTDQQGLDLLVKMGYDKDEAKLLIDTNVYAITSPETPLEYEQLVNSYNKALGRPVIDVSQDRIDAEKAMIEAKTKLEKAREANTSPEILTSLESDYYLRLARFKEL